MSFDWIHYIYVAQKTIEETPDQEPDEEAKRRSAMSRAYYAAFCHARIYLNDKNIHIIYKTVPNRKKGTRNPGSHEAVIYTLLENTKNCTSQEKSILKQLDNFRILRKYSDYPDLNGNWTHPPSRDKVIQHITTCKNIIDIIKQLQKMP